MIITVALSLAMLTQQNVPSVKVSLKPGKGNLVTGTVEVTLPEGWHAYQNPPKSEYETPLKIESKTKGFKLTSVTYPAGKAMMSSGSESLVYEGTVSIPFKAEVSKSLKATKGQFKAQVSVSYQICDDHTCLPPSAATANLIWKAVSK